MHFCNMDLDELPARPIRAGWYRTNPGWTLGTERTAVWTDLTLWLLLDGRATVTMPEHGTFDLLPGDCLLLRGGEASTISPVRGQRLAHWFAHFDYLDPKGRVLPLSSLTLPPRLRRLPEPDRAGLLWERLSSTLRSQPARAQHWLTALRQEIAHQERQSTQHAPADPVAVGLADFAARMHRDPADPHRVSLWATRLGISREQVRRRFTAAYGRSPRDYLTQERLHLAEHLLRESSSSIAAIAEQAGYATQYFFSRHFTAHRGCSPSAFRQRR